MSVSLEQFVLKTQGLLEKERQAEIDETRSLQENVTAKELEKRGVCLLRMRIGSQHSGMYGRTVLLFEPYYPGKEMPSHSFTPGDIAGVSLTQSDNPSENLASGIVSKVTTSSVHVAFDDSQEKLELDDDAQYKLVKLANDVTYRRLKKGLEELNSYHSGPSGNMINTLFGVSTPSPPVDFISNLPTKDLTWYNEKLDDSQKEAVRFALSQKETAVIHGPPGTGKTTTVVEILLQAVHFNQKVLVCAPSNIAVDNLVERLAGKGPKIIRLGHPARVLPHIQKYSLDAILASSDGTQLVKDVRQDMDKALAKLRKSRDKGERQQAKTDLKFLRKELREREDSAMAEILKRSNIVLATLTSAGNDGPLRHLKKEPFDLVVIDECSQSMEAACWIALLHAPRCILAGDHHQLPPTIISIQAAKEGLAVTLMERVISMYGETTVRMLTTQYRMNELIMQWASEQLYQGKLKAHHSVAQHLLQDLEAVEKTEETSTALLLIDTAGCDIQELNVPDEMSKGNEGEADLVTFHVEQLIVDGVQPVDIAVITPYNLQVELLRLRLLSKYPKLEIKSVDGFQGREKEAVVISLVRSNQKGEVGFLAEDRRINVAITRARRHLAVVCDTETVGNHKFLKTLIDFMNANGEVRSAQQYIHDGLELKQLADLNKMSMGARPKVKPSTGAKVKSNKQENNNKKQQKEFREDKEKVTRPPVISCESVVSEDSIIAELAAFIADPHKKAHAFPISFSSKERYIVHEVAEKMGLLHISQGEGTDRHIIVSKKESHSLDQIKSALSTSKPNKTDKTGNISNHASNEQQISDNKKGSTSKDAQKPKQENVISEETVMEDKSKKPHENSVFDHIKCKICQREVPKSNYDLHVLRCKPTPALTENIVSQKKPKSAKNKKNKLKSQVTAGPAHRDIVKVDEEDFDALIAAAVKNNSSCGIKKCKANAATLGRNCPFCSQRFCIEHHMPELHGCGDAAKAHARRVISKEGVLYQGGGVPNKRPDAEKRAQLQRKMDKKLQDLGKQRQQKKKGK